MSTTEKQQVIKAVEKLGGNVTAADVATETGLSPDLATRELNIIALETGGRLQVAKSGDIAYSFSPGFAGKYLARGLHQIAKALADRIVELAYYVVKISFGIGLLMSLGVILLIVAPNLLGE